MLEDLQKTVLVHVKIVDHSNTGYEEEGNDQRAGENNFTHYYNYPNVLTEDFKQTCSGRFKKQVINKIAGEGKVFPW